nr:protein TPLATE [Tanacetum cinerariifolium]
MTSLFDVTAAAISILAAIPSFNLGKLISDCSNHISACFNSTSENLRFLVTKTLGCVLARDDLVTLCENSVALLEKVKIAELGVLYGGVCSEEKEWLMARSLVLPLESFRASVYPLVYGVKSVASGSIEAITKLLRSKSGVDWSKAERFLGVSDVVTHLASSLDPALIFEVGINMLFLANVPGGKPEWASTSIIAILTLWDKQEFLLRERVLLELLLPTYIFSILVCRFRYLKALCVDLFASESVRRGQKPLIGTDIASLFEDTRIRDDLNGVTSKNLFREELVANLVES